MSVALEIHRTDEDDNDEFDEVEASAAATRGVRSSTRIIQQGECCFKFINQACNCCGIAWIMNQPFLLLISS